MSGVWVFFMDPKNFLALIGTGTMLKWAVQITLWFTRPRRVPGAVNLNKD